MFLSFRLQRFLLEHYDSLVNRKQSFVIIPFDLTKEEMSGLNMLSEYFIVKDAWLSLDVNQHFLPLISKEKLSSFLFAGYHIDYDLLVTSTLDRMNDLSQKKIAIAEKQYASRGQYKRTWQNSFGQSLQVSIGGFSFTFNEGQIPLNFLSGWALIRTLEELGINELKFKWPNDVYLHGSKIAGFLVHADRQTRYAMFSFGLNIYYSSLLDNITSLADRVVPRPYLRETIIARFINYVNSYAQVDRSDIMKQLNEKNLFRSGDRIMNKETKQAYQFNSIAHDGTLCVTDLTSKQSLKIHTGSFVKV